MSAIISWEGHNIEVTVQPSARYLFLAGEFAVKVDGHVVARKGGLSHRGGLRLGYTQSLRGSFPHDTEKAQLELVTRQRSPLSMEFVLRINDVDIGQGRVGIERVGFGVLAWLIAVWVVVLGGLLLFRFLYSVFA